jgi:mRNA interferase RelE/StbE
MSDRYHVEWEPTAQGRAMTLADDDPSGVLAVFDAVDLLADNPRPRGAFPYGPNALRLQVGLYRAMAEIDDDARTVRITHIGHS